MNYNDIESVKVAESLRAQILELTERLQQAQDRDILKGVEYGVLRDALNDALKLQDRYRKALIGIVEGYRFGRFPDAIRMADEALLPDIECPVCRARLGLGVAITQKRTLGCMSYTISDTKISRCLKCPQCGHSETIEG